MGSLARQRRGVVAVLGAMLMGLAGLSTGAAVDISRLATLRADLKQATDASALAAARDPGDASRLRAETMFDTVMAQGSHRVTEVNRTYTLEDGHHIVAASATLKSLVLGVIGTDLMVAVAESAAVTGADKAENASRAPCIHVGDRGNEPVLVMHPGALIRGEGCILVLEDDNPSRVIIDGGELDIAGFCVMRGGSPVRIEALASRLGLPHLPGECNGLETRIFPDTGGCTALPEQTLPVRVKTTGAPGHYYNGGVYCGTVRLNEPGKTVYQSSTSPVLMSRDGDMYLTAQALKLGHNTLIVEQTLPDLIITVQEPSYLRAPDTGPYAGVAVIQRDTPGFGSIIRLNGPITITGQIIAPGLKLSLDGGPAMDIRDMDPIRADRLEIKAGTRVRFNIGNVDVVTTSPRLIR